MTRFVFKKDRCQVCKTPLVPVIYGMPGPKMIDLAEDGLIKLGGCSVKEQKFACLQCETECPDCGDTDRTAGDTECVNCGHIFNEILDLDFRCPEPTSEGSLEICDNVLSWDNSRTEWFCQTHPGSSEDDYEWNLSLQRRQGGLTVKAEANDRSSR